MEIAISDLSAMESDKTVVTKVTAGSVDETVARLSELVTARSLTRFAIIDHSGEARRAGLELRDTKVVIFGSAEAGTPVMQSAPLAALARTTMPTTFQDKVTASSTRPRRSRCAEASTSPIATVRPQRAR